MPPVGQPSLGRRSPSARARHQSLPPVETVSRSSPPVRLRYLLLFLLLAFAGAWLWPRGVAAWRLHNLGVKKADYALCMVGPTGPALLREEPAALSDLLRKRIVTAGPSKRPFASCSSLAEDLDMPHRALSAHTQQAREFVEYRAGPGITPTFSVNDLVLTTEDLEELSQQAWPFVRHGYLRLIEPSRHAREAVHPATAPQPGTGRGLPASRFHYRSTLAFGQRVVGAFGSGANARTLLSDDAGVTWSSGGKKLASEIIDRCPADEEGRAFSLSLTEAGRQMVLSQGPAAPPQAAQLSEPGEILSSITCDESALVAALLLEEDEKGRRPVRLRLCPFRRPCRDLIPPEQMGGLFYPADVARLGGDIVLARTYRGLTRVTSTRDDGRSWAPWTVAFDSVSAELPASAAPYRLLPISDRTLLFGRPSKDDGSYVLLVSDDHGASFRAPSP